MSDLAQALASLEATAQGDIAAAADVPAVDALLLVTVMGDSTREPLANVSHRTL